MEHVINIGSNQRLTRKWVGVGFVITGLAVGIYMIYIAFPVSWHLVTFGLVYTGILAYLESRDGVCPLNAARGMESMTGYVSFGKDAVLEPEKVSAARQIAMKQLWQSLWLSVLIVLPFVALKLIF